MVLVELERPYLDRKEPEYFYAWIRYTYGLTKGRISWDKGDDISRVVKYLTLHRLKITKIALRRDYVHLSVEDSALQDMYETLLKEYIL